MNIHKCAQARTRFKRHSKSSELSLQVDFIFQSTHLIASQMKAINPISTKIPSLYFPFKRKVELPRYPVPPSQQQVGRCADAALRLARGGGGRSLHEEICDTETCAWALFSAHRPRSKWFFLPFLTSKEANAAKMCNSGQNAEGW